MMNFVCVTGFTNNNITYSETNKSFKIANSQVINNSKSAYSKAGAAYTNEASRGTVTLNRLQSVAFTISGSTMLADRREVLGAHLDEGN